MYFYNWSAEGIFPKQNNSPTSKVFQLQKFISQGDKILTDKKVLDRPDSNNDALLTRDRVLLPFTSKLLFCKS
jgi:hypothetical protein